MDKSVLAKSEFSTFIGRMLAEYQVFGPSGSDGITSFKCIKDLSELDLEFSNSIVPPKALLFRQTETLFKFTWGRTVAIDPMSIPDEKIAIFGIRPCDAKSLAILDRVFKGEWEDPYYLARRKNAVLVGLSCSRPGVNCFCTSFDDGPASSENMDILLTDIGEKYYVEVRSDKGKQLTASTKELLTPATQKDEKKKGDVEEKAAASIARRMIVEGLIAKLDNIFESSFWRKISMKCLGCGICTYLCPTCHCFDIQDEITLVKGARVRVWDTCMFPEYTRHASGHNPRPDRMNRVRNRIYHKYNYYPKNFDVTACVGCGRCIDSCPVNMDIIDVVSKAKEVRI